VPLRPLGYEGARSRLTGSHPYSHVPCDQPPGHATVSALALSATAWRYGSVTNLVTG